jgi:PAS domain S-box-containing protein
MEGRVAWQLAPRGVIPVGLLIALAVALPAVAVLAGVPSLGASLMIGAVAEVAAAVTAVAAAGYAATQTEGRIRVAWLLMLVAAVAWSAGQILELSSSAWGEAAFVAAVPFAVGGVRAFWSPAGAATSPSRLWLDGAIVALALTFTAWTLGLREVFQGLDRSGAEKLLEVAGAVGDIVIATTVVMALRRATRRRAARVFVLLLGVALVALADDVAAVLPVSRPAVVVAGRVAGYLLIALAAGWPRAPIRVAREVALVDLWQLVLPWLAVLAIGVSTLGVILSGQTLDLVLTLIVGVTVILLAVSMILASRDFLRMLAKSQASEATLAEVVERAPVGIARADTHFRIIGANPGLGALLGVRPEGLVGLTFDRYIPVEDQPQMFEKLGRLISGVVENVEREGWVIRADGSRLWARWTSTAVKDGVGQTDYYLTILEDVDARHKADEAARASLDTLDRLNRLKSEFLQSVSHEFKTALIGIQGFSEFMRDSDQLEINDVRGFAEDIHRDAERLDRMVGEMIALDHVESARANLRLSDTDVNALIEEEVAVARPKTSSVINLDLQHDLPTVSADREKLADVIRTLLGQAVKFTPEGGRITVRSRGGDTDVTVSIGDEGTAARADFDNRLFGQDDLYANNPIRKVVGTGLGLGIVRQVVEMHGGRLWADHIDGVGSEYHFMIPISVRPAGVAGPAPTETAVAPA